MCIKALDASLITLHSVLETTGKPMQSLNEVFASFEMPTPCADYIMAKQLSFCKAF